MTPEQRHDLDREINYEARDYDKWKANNADMLMKFRREREKHWHEVGYYDRLYMVCLWGAGVSFSFSVIALLIHFVIEWRR